MNVLFVYSFKDSHFSQKPLSDLNALQFGISYISSFIKKQGHETKLLVLTQGMSSDSISNIIDEFSPSLICFTAVYSEYQFVANAAEIIKKCYPNIFLIAGGPHVSLNPEECLLDSFDALCIGEGEEAVLELIGQLEKKIKPTAIANLWIKKNDGVEKNLTRSFLQNIDILPFPDREMWEEWTENINSESQKILLGRGCPFLCTYCCNHALRKLATGNYIRHRAPESVIEEIKYIIRRY
ncbi:MAG: cobalamin-dependent protein, partial [Minisyncoccia bacterium]